MKIYGKEVDFKLSNLKDAGNFELALKHLAAKEDEVRKMKENTPLSEVLSVMIGTFREFFRDATGEDVLAECHDFEEAKQVYVGFLREIKKQKETVLSFSLDDIK